MVDEGNEVCTYNRLSRKISHLNVRKLLANERFRLTRKPQAFLNSDHLIRLLAEFFQNILMLVARIHLPLKGKAITPINPNFTLCILHLL